MHYHSFLLIKQSQVLHFMANSKCVPKEVELTLGTHVFKLVCTNANPRFKNTRKPLFIAYNFY